MRARRGARGPVAAAWHGPVAVARCVRLGRRGTARLWGEVEDRAACARVGHARWRRAARAGEAGRGGERLRRATGKKGREEKEERKRKKRGKKKRGEGKKKNRKKK